MGHAGSHLSRRGESSLMQSLDAKLILQHRITAGRISKHLALCGGWGVWPPSLWRHTHAHLPTRPIENMHKVVSWAECGLAALTLNLGRYCGARSPLFFWKCLSFCLVLLVRAPFPMAFPQPEVHSHSFPSQVMNYLMGFL